MRRHSALGRLTPAGQLLLAVGIACFCSCSGNRETADPEPEAVDGVAWFFDATAASGIDFEHETGARGELLLTEVMGGGVALLDVDADGDLDLYLTNAAAAGRLFLNEQDGRFTDATEASGLGGEGHGMGVAAGDVDNDGDVDLYLTNDGPDRLYRNRGDGSFEEVSGEAGIGGDGWSASAIFFDLDRDGFLDLWVTRYVRYDPSKRCTDGAGRSDYCSPAAFLPLADVLLRNAGDGTFIDVSRESGIASVRAAGLGVVSDDFDGDGWPDVYVANDGDPNQLWINQRDGSFRDEAVIRGVAYDLHGKAEAGMGVIAADLDNDLDTDIFLTHLANESNTFYLNGGSGGFTDATGVGGLAARSLTSTGFGTAAIDLRHLGRLDLVIANGRVTLGTARADASVPAPWDRLAEPNQLFLNTGEGRFEAAVAGRLPDGVEVTRGLAIGDVDGDGAIDLLFGNLESGARLLLNRFPGRGHWISVRAIDPRLQRDAIGAHVTVVAGDLRQRRTVTRAFSYLSSSDPRAHFGLGRRTTIDRIEVLWPDGLTETFEVPAVDRAYSLVRGSAGPAS